MPPPSPTPSWPARRGAQRQQVEEDPESDRSRRAPLAEVPLAAVSLPESGPHPATPAPRSYRRGLAANRSRRSRAPRCAAATFISDRCHPKHRQPHSAAPPSPPWPRPEPHVPPSPPWPRPPSTARFPPHLLRTRPLLCLSEAGLAISGKVCLPPFGSLVCDKSLIASAARPARAGGLF
ncbi:basic proline-rich protein-like [Phodopus roborovskii]|uniref:basic proline-rich protein-like n=1 Tax=Phodopus roborovskii TaxID=109678 RepID=UPI0021E3D1D4|nr:basic proline-rich protein-like [Phodopus roborovskii]